MNIQLTSRPRHHLVKALPALLGALALVAVLAAQASAMHASSAQPGITLRPRFERVRSPSTTSFLNSSRWVFADTGSGTGVLIDDNTGRQRSLSFASACRPLALGASTLALTCTSGSPAPDIQQLYDIPTGQTSTFTASPALTQSPFYDNCIGSEICPPEIEQLGSRWVALDIGKEDYHTLDRFVFQNLQTGQVASDPARPDTTVNLNRTGLTQGVCRPLAVPTFHGPYDNQPGSLTPIGNGFEIATAPNAYLERCGTHLHRFLTSLAYTNANPNRNRCAAVVCPPAANPRVVVWASPPPSNQIHGIFLPSLQRFSIPVPTRIDPSDGTNDEYGVGLTAHRLYLSSGTRLWSTPAPTPPATRSRKRTRR